jgi:hypothetical protein
MVHVGGNLPVLGGYQTALQNQAGYQPVLSIRTGWVSSGCYLGWYPEYRVSFLREQVHKEPIFHELKKIIHTWVGYVNNPKYDS